MNGCERGKRQQTVVKDDHDGREPAEPIEHMQALQRSMSRRLTNRAVHRHAAIGPRIQGLVRVSRRRVRPSES